VKKSWYQLTPHLCAIFLLFYCSNVYWGEDRYKGFFLADANGYYAYLPATFIYNDFNFSFFEPIGKKYFSTHSNFDIRAKYRGKDINKCYSGTSVAILPFFLVGHGISLLEDENIDGYSYWYALTMSLAAIFYCFIGLIALQKILHRYFKNDKLISLLLILILFGTNLFYYTTSEPLMSHIYSFAFINLFVLSVMNFIEEEKKKFIYLSAFFLGMIVLIRPVNGLVIFILPFIAGSQQIFFKMIKNLFKSYKQILLAALIFLSILFIQLIYYKLETGSWLIYSYGNEKINFLKPHIADFLFSYRKGLFLYTPLILLSLAGLIFLYGKNKWQFYSISLFIFLLIYVFSSWWNWWYGGSFGMRPMIEYYFAFTVFLGFAFENLLGKWKSIFLTMCFACLVICQVQTYQFRYYFIHWDEMTKDRYWKVFMRVDLIVKKENPNADLLN
jgi:hypothetical protein